MKKYRITYQPFTQSDVTASDRIVFAKDEAEAREVFEKNNPGFGFVRADEEA